MPHRIDVRCPTSDALDVLVELGALDIEQVKTGLPPSYRDNGSIWLVSARPVRVGSFSVVSPEVIAQPRALRLVDSRMAWIFELSN